MSGDLDGLRLDSLEIGEVYDVGISLATYLMSCGFAIPIVDERPARIVPLDQGDVHDTVRKATGIARSLTLLPFSKRESM
jgi:hypothetical protein